MARRVPGRGLALILGVGLMGACVATEDADTTEGEAPATAVPAALPSVTILQPADGAELQGDSVYVELTSRDMVILPAGDTTPGSGHHHLLLNADAPPEGEPIPAGVEGIIHLGQAQTEHTFRDLPPGDYTLVAMLGDLVHRVIPQAADTVHFTVVPPQ